MKVDELRVLEADELSIRMRQARRELYELRFKHAVGQLENSSQISKVRHDIARIMTVLRERDFGIVASFVADALEPTAVDAGIGAGGATRNRSSTGGGRGQAKAHSQENRGTQMTDTATAIKPETQATDAETRGQRKVRLGTVIADKMNKTIIVQVGTSKAHRLYRKTVQRRTKFKVHDEKNECGVGDLVRITETRPISKEKRWRVLEIVEKAK